MMLYFDSDYLEGAHSSILEKLVTTNFEQTPGYGNDTYCESAREKIRQACNCPEAQVHFLVGGTQTNATVIDGLLKSYEGVIGVDSAHIELHEAGAIEFGGHKVITLPQEEGKLKASEVEKYLTKFYGDESFEHMTIPGAVYISHPTEWGTLYTKQELADLSAICHKYNLPLFLDGARLGYGLASLNTDVTMQDIAKYCDVFYIGGTKVGALFGEAVVITKPNLIPHFFTIIKQHIASGLDSSGNQYTHALAEIFLRELTCAVKSYDVDKIGRLALIAVLVSSASSVNCKCISCDRHRALALGIAYFRVSG